MLIVFCEAPCPSFVHSGADQAVGLQPLLHTGTRSVIGTSGIMLPNTKDHNMSHGVRVITTG